MGRDIGMAAGKRGGGALEVSRKVACKRHAGSTGCPRGERRGVTMKEK